MKREKFQRRDYVNTICWECKWATGLEGKCPWAGKGKPVKGWKAKKTKIKSASSNWVTKSYIVIKCPLFDPDER